MRPQLSFLLDTKLTSMYIMTLSAMCVNAADDEGKFAPIAAFECRGLDPIDWRPEVRTLCLCPS